MCFVAQTRVSKLVVIGSIFYCLLTESTSNPCMHIENRRQRRKEQSNEKIMRNRVLDPPPCPKHPRTARLVALQCLSTANQRTASTANKKAASCLVGHARVQRACSFLTAHHRRNDLEKVGQEFG